MAKLARLTGWHFRGVFVNMRLIAFRATFHRVEASKLQAVKSHLHAPGLPIAITTVEPPAALSGFEGFENPTVEPPAALSGFGGLPHFSASRATRAPTLVRAGGPPPRSFQPSIGHRLSRRPRHAAAGTEEPVGTDFSASSFTKGGTTGTDFNAFVITSTHDHVYSSSPHSLRAPLQPQPFPD